MLHSRSCDRKPPFSSRTIPAARELPSWYGIWSTVDDMVKFDAALSSGSLLRPETLQQMWTPTTLKNGKIVRIEQMPYGLGWFVLSVAGHRIVAHPGWTGTFYLKFPDDRVTIILLSNLDAGSGSASDSDLIHSPLGSFHLSHSPAKANNFPPSTSKQYGELYARSQQN